MDFNLPGMDTKTLSETGVAMPVLRADGKPLEVKAGVPVTITLLGPDSAVYRKMNRASVRKRMQLAAAKQEQSFEDEEHDVVEILAACTKSWTGVVDAKGAEIPCTAENAEALYTSYPTIRDQVDLFIANRARFTAAS